MYASMHPLDPGTLVIEIPADELLDVHGTLVMDMRNRGPATARDQLMSIIEAAHAGTLGDRYHRPDDDPVTRLEYLREALRAESMSWGELAELQHYGETGQIPADDLELREAAGLPEHDDEPCPSCQELIARGVPVTCEKGQHEGLS